MQLKNYTAKPYTPGKNRFTRIIWYGINALFLKGFIPSSFIRVGVLKMFGAKIGKGVVIKPCVNIKYPWFLTIGDYTWIGENCWIDNLGLVEIGSNACLSQGVSLITGNHNYKSVKFELRVEPIYIKDGAWIAAFAKVCPGTVVEKNAVVGMGSVASGIIEENGVYAGNPAIYIKRRQSES